MRKIEKCLKVSLKRLRICSQYQTFMISIMMTEAEIGEREREAE
jgi:hypothetical protein